MPRFEPQSSWLSPQCYPFRAGAITFFTKGYLCHHLDLIVAVWERYCCSQMTLKGTKIICRDRKLRNAMPGTHTQYRHSRIKGAGANIQQVNVLHSRSGAWHVPHENGRPLQSRCICLLSVLFLLKNRSCVRNFVAEQLQLASKFALPSLRWRRTQNPTASEQHTHPHIAATTGTKTAPMLHREGPWSSSTITGWPRLVG